MSKQRGISDAQANAEALANRGRTYADPNAASFRISWDANRRAPRDLRHAEHLCRSAYRDEVPTKIHEAGLADDGTPKMTAKFEAYIFGDATWTDAGRSSSCDCGKPLRDVRGIMLPIHDRSCPALTNHAESFYLTPFRARLAEMERHSAESTRKHAAIVSHVTIGGQTGESAAIAEGVPEWCSRLVAFTALSSFLRGLTDVSTDVAKGSAAA